MRNSQSSVAVLIFPVPSTSPQSSIQAGRRAGWSVVMTPRSQTAGAVRQSDRPAVPPPSTPPLSADGRSRYRRTDKYGANRADAASMAHVKSGGLKRTR